MPQDKQPGTRWYSLIDNTIVQVIEPIGSDLVRIWIPDTNTVVIREITSLIAPCDSPTKTLEQIVTRAGIEQVRLLTSREPLLSPLAATILPLPHQLYALARACATQPVRFLLADEVGLGKTIEAGLILSELKRTGKVSRILIVTPSGLTRQWQRELSEKFGEEFDLITPSNFPDIGSIWKRFNQIIVSIDAIKPTKVKGSEDTHTKQRNKERFDSLIKAGWDLIIVDESHRIAGTNEQVARYQLGRALSKASPHLLLLSATPHQGKTDAFVRLMGHIDSKQFKSEEDIIRDKVSGFVIRTEKRQAIDPDGNPLFLARKTRVIVVPRDLDSLEAKLYDEVTTYVKEWYNHHKRANKNLLHFLLLLYQRLVSSSTSAITTTLNKRAEFLDGMILTTSVSSDQEDWWEDIESSEGIGRLISSSSGTWDQERSILDSILILARSCLNSNCDQKSLQLEGLIREKIIAEQDSSLKFLIFTEFVATQEMLVDFLINQGFSVTYLNGNMDASERAAVLRDFSNNYQILVSTEAGGEGLNLQFCHVVINYDLPWNPMRLEQRIGRVDRIGQDKDVEVYNFVLEGTVEEKVQQVIINKLNVILADLGFDKISDVLDSSEAESRFEDLYIASLISPQEMENRINSLINLIRDRARLERASWENIGIEPDLSPTSASAILHHPLPYWLSRIVPSYIVQEGGKISRSLFGIDARLPDGTYLSGMVFSREDALQPGTILITLSHPLVQSFLANIPRSSPTIPISEIIPSGVSLEPGGIWSLWHIYPEHATPMTITVVPVYLDPSGRFYSTTAFRIFELVGRGECKVTGVTHISQEKWTKIEEHIFQMSKEISKVADIYPVLILAIGERT